jgi:hypothetical protein
MLLRLANRKLNLLMLMELLLFSYPCRVDSGRVLCSWTVCYLFLGLDLVCSPSVLIACLLLHGDGVEIAHPPGYVRWTTGQGLGMALNSAMRAMRRVQIPVPPSATSRLLYELLGRVRLGFLVVPPFELHVYSSMWSEAEALSEYGVVPKQFIYLFYRLGTCPDKPCRMPRSPTATRTW